MATKRFCDHCNYDITDSRRAWKAEFKLGAPPAKTGAGTKVLDLCAACATRLRRAVDRPEIIEAAA